MLYELGDRIIWTVVSSILTPGARYVYGAIHELNKNSGELTTLCISAFNTAEEAEAWVRESFRNRFPLIPYNG